MRILHFPVVVAMILVMSMTITGTASDDSAEVFETEPWYLHWTLDADQDRIDDRLEQEFEENQFEGTYPLFVDYLSMPGEHEIAFLVDLGLTINYVAKYMPTIAVQGADYHDIFILSSQTGIVMVERDYPIEPFLDTSSPGTKARPSAFYSPDTAWEEGFTGDGVVIAILDTGVDDSHESLDGKFVAGVDVSNQGFDVNGNPDDGNGHGSHCAGIAMGTGGNTDDDDDGEADYKGTAPDAQLVDVKIGTDLGGNLGNSIVRGIEWCRENKDTYDIRILSISFGSTSSSDGQDATSRAANDAVLEDGLILVAAAGNSGPNNDGLPPPASADEVITVANVDNKETVQRGDEEIADSSSRGPRDDDGDDDHLDELKPEISAPGENINSVQYSEYGQGNPNLQGMYVEKSGTSMACPHISGIVACMLEANPNLTPLEVKEILKETADVKGEPYDPELDDDYSREYGWGLADAHGAVKGALGDMPSKDDVEIKITSPADGKSMSDTETIRGTVTTEGEATIDSITISVGENEYDVPIETPWSYNWDSWDVDNGNHTLTATVYGNNRTISDTSSITITVNNTGDPPDNDEDSFSIEDLQELNEYTISIGAVLAILVVIAVILVVRKRRGSDDDDDEEDPDLDDDGEEDEDQEFEGGPRPYRSAPRRGGPPGRRPRQPETWD
jgi:serine protease AprX